MTRAVPLLLAALAVLTASLYGWGLAEHDGDWPMPAFGALAWATFLIGLAANGAAWRYGGAATRAFAALVLVVPLVGWAAAWWTPAARIVGWCGQVLFGWFVT